MLKYILRRLFFAIFVMIGVSIIAFGIMHLAPGDPARLLLADGAPEEDVQALREELGLNEPLHIQYFIYMRGVLQGDLGTSLFFRVPNTRLIFNRIPNSLILSMTGVFGAMLFSVPLGIIAGYKEGSFIDFFAVAFAILGLAMVSLWLAFVLILIFSVKLQLLPAFGMGGIKSLVLPAIVLGLPFAALVTRITRAGTIDVLSEDYILAIRAKGIGEFKVVTRYALKNILIPIITVVGIQFAFIISAGVVTETIFSWPGIGSLVMMAIYGRDFPLVQALLLVISGMIVIINLTVDILYTLVDPRVKF